MTHIVQGFKTKKALKERLMSREPGVVLFNDPSIFDPKPRHVRYTEATMETSFAVGESLVCTNHPKRSWFAKVERTAAGFKVT